MKFLPDEEENPPSGNPPGAGIKRLEVLVAPRYYGLSANMPPRECAAFHVVADSCEFDPARNRIFITIT